MDMSTLTEARILIVDDEPANVRVLERMLGRAGYTDLVGTTDAREAVPLYLARRPDAILLDLHMPHLDGFAVMEALRPHLPEDDYLPILVLTADVTPAAKQRALSGGAKDFLTKPFDQTELLLRLRNLLETRLLYLHIRQRNQLLEQLYTEVQQAMQARDASLSAITHDLGQPLASIRVAARLLEQRSASQDVSGAGINEEVAIIGASVARMYAMIGELLDLARLQAGRQLDLRYEPTDLVALVQEEVTAQQKLASRHRIRIEAAAPALVGEWDPDRLRRVVVNLLSNAIKYSPAGSEVGITLTEQRADGRRWAVLEVRDEGVGIPDADLPHIMDRFHRGANVAGRVAGTGIGLASVREIVVQHGGAIAVESTEGKGTVVTLRLPLA
jgi:signal transduction histidine kinase